MIYLFSTSKLSPSVILFYIKSTYVYSSGVSCKAPDVTGSRTRTCVYFRPKNMRRTQCIQSKGVSIATPHRFYVILCLLQTAHKPLSLLTTNSYNICQPLDARTWLGYLRNAVDPNSINSTYITLLSFTQTILKDIPPHHGDVMHLLFHYITAARAVTSKHAYRLLFKQAQIISG